MTATQKPSTPKLITAISVFFFWGFVAASNGIFIPFCKSHFGLSQLQSQLIDTAFYGAYFYGSLILYLISYIKGIDIINKIGYKNTIVVGLILSVVGSLLLYVFSGAQNVSFNSILVAFFVIALGFSLQQTGAQPFLASMGSDETGSHRLNLGGGINSLGTLLGPIVVSALLFKGAQNIDPKDIPIQTIQNLYLFLAILFIAVATLFYFTKFEEKTFSENVEKSYKGLILLILIGLMVPAIIFVKEISEFLTLSKIVLLLLATALIVFFISGGHSLSKKNKNGWGALQYPQLALGMIGIFVYVGTEVTIQSNLGGFLKHTYGTQEDKISHYISLYWGSLMIGRWVGALGLFNLSNKTRKLLYYIVSLSAFGIITLVNFIKGNDISQFSYYIPYVLVIISLLILADSRPDRSLIILCTIGALLMIVGATFSGPISIFSFIAGGLCCSIGWPCIFAMGVAGLKQYTSQGSAMMVMMILGGAVIPPLQGAICDINFSFLGLSAFQVSYIIPAIGFIYMAIHGYISGNVLKKQGIDFASLAQSGH